MRVERLLYSGNSLDKMRQMFEGATGFLQRGTTSGARVVDKRPKI